MTLGSKLQVFAMVPIRLILPAPTTTLSLRKIPEVSSSKPVITSLPPTAWKRGMISSLTRKNSSRPPSALQESIPKKRSLLLQRTTRNVIATRQKEGFGLERTACCWKRQKTDRQRWGALECDWNDCLSLLFLSLAAVPLRFSQELFFFQFDFN